MFCGCLGELIGRPIKKFFSFIPESTAKSEDFLVFEFGWKRTYLFWRASCFVLLLVLVLTMPLLDIFPSCLGDVMYMHGLLILLLALGLLLEVIVLFRILVTFSFWKLEKPKLPFSLKLVWLQYCVLYPNIISCAFMYSVWFSDFRYDIPEKATLQYLITFYAIVHVFTTAIPSHLSDVIKPVIFNLIYLVFSRIWQINLTARSVPAASDLSAYTNASLEYIWAHRYALYSAMDWDHWPSATGVALFWIVTTAVCYILVVLVAWGRRRVFYEMRKPQSNPIMLPSRSESLLENQLAPQVKTEAVTTLSNNTNHSAAGSGQNNRDSSNLPLSH